MRIFLIGFMGCGKSTLGRQTAKKLMFDFVDMDNYIEEIEGKKIPEIFAEKGEKYFREIERKAIEDLSKKENIVIATGGGAATHSDNIEYMNKKGITIYLKMNSGILVSRVMASSTPRPLLQGKSKEEMLATVDQMLSQREPFYEKAHIIINNKNIKVDDIIEEVKKW